MPAHVSDRALPRQPSESPRSNAEVERAVLVEIREVLRDVVQPALSGERVRDPMVVEALGEELIDGKEREGGGGDNRSADQVPLRQKRFTARGWLRVKGGRQHAEQCGAADVEPATLSH